MSAYPLLCHLASKAGPGSGSWAVLALACLIVWCLLDGLWSLRVSDWLLLAGSLALLCVLAASKWVPMLLLAPPIVFPLWIAWLFARTLLPGCTPLILRIVEAVHARAGMPVEPALRIYIHRLTAGWALVLTLLAMINFALALSVSPDGPLLSLGYSPLWPVTAIQYLGLASVATWGLLGGFAVLEYLWRTVRFPQRPDRNLLHFGCLLFGLGPAFWRDLLR